MKNHLAATSARSISAVMMMVLGLGACASPKNEEDAIEQRQSALTYPLPNATGDPQFFGFGYPQLAIMDGTNLQVLASPVRVQDAPWTTRWLSPLAAAPPVIVAGDFWHTGDGKARLLAIKNGAVTVQDPPEVPSSATWAAVGTAQTLPNLPSTTIIDAAAGDFLGRNKDQLVVMTSARLVIYEPPTSPGGAWVRFADVALPTAATSMAAGEFWSGISDDEEMRYRSGYKKTVDENGLFAQGIGHGPHGMDKLCLLRSDGRLAFYSWSAGAWTLYRTSSNTVSGKLAAGDFLRHARENIAVVSTGTTKTISVYDAPLADNGPAALVMSANITDRVPSTITDVTADRLFGYVDQTVSVGARRGTIPTSGSDVEIAFMERTPVYKKDHNTDNYGWPSLNEPVTYTVYLKNNGTTPIPAGTANVKFWLNRTARNADILASTAFDDTKSNAVAIPPFNPNATFAQNYVPVVAKTFPWPYSLIDDGAPGNWKKLNLDTVGERWTIASVTASNDLTVRNNRREMALHAWLLHPVYQTPATLADRQPTISKDPASIEYLTAKLGDFIGVAWARSHAGDKTGAAIRVAFDGYSMRSEYPTDKDAREALEEEGWQTWESRRDLTTWFGSAWEIGKYCSWESDEMHETGHHFHELGDLYQYFSEPTQIGALKLADGRVPQFRSWVWSHQEHADNCNVFSENDVLMHKHVVGMRNLAREPESTHVGWDRIAPKKIFIKVLDRNGNPIPNARVAVWRQRDLAEFHFGNTDAAGVWDTGHPYGEVPVLMGSSAEPHYPSATALMGQGTVIYVTIDVNGYRDAAVMGADGHRALGLYTLAAAWHLNPDTYTWTWKTNYLPAAAPFTAPVTAAVSGGNLAINVGATGTYRLYRLLPPTYDRIRLGADFAGGTTVTDNLMTVDGIVNAFGTPARATYEITSISGGAESLPTQLTLHQTTQLNGVTDMENGKLLVGNKLLRNAADQGLFVTSTVLSVFKGTTPEREYLYHPWWDRVAMKAAMSATPDKVYVALDDKDDAAWFTDHLVEVNQPMPGDFQGLGPWSLTLVPFVSMVADSKTAHTITKSGVDFVALGVNPGDRLTNQGVDAQITGVTATQITMASHTLPTDPTVEGYTTAFAVYQNAGQRGTNVTWRQLQSVRGIASFRDAANKEYVAIADPVGQKVVFWDDKTKYVNQYAPGGLNPTGIAKHPLKTGVVFVLDRSATTRIVQLKLSAGAVTVDGTSTLPTALPAAVDREIGLAATASGTDVLLAVVNNTGNSIVEYKLTAAGGLTQQAVYTNASTLAPFIGSAALSKPRDVAYSVSGTTRGLYASDGDGQRLVLVASASTGGTGGTGGAGGSGGTGGAGGTGGRGGSGGAGGGGGGGGAGGAGGSAGAGGRGGTGGTGGASGAGGSAGSAGSSGLKIQYRTADTLTNDNQIKPVLQVVNTGTLAVPMSELKIRYWYTNEAGIAQTANCDWAAVNCTNVTRAFVAVSPVRPLADTYLEVGFSAGAGSVAAGANSGEIQLRTNKNDWSNYNEANDHSYDVTKTVFADWNRVTLYRNGALVWGTEP